MVNKELIDRGMVLKRLKESEDFAVLKAEMDARISQYSEMILNSHESSYAQTGINYYLNRLQGLKELLSWIDDEISGGERELIRLRSEQSKPAPV